MRIIEPLRHRIVGRLIGFIILLAPSFWLLTSPLYSQQLGLFGKYTLSGQYSMQPGIVLFSDDFESDDTDLVPTWDYNNNVTYNTLSTDYAHSGTRAGRFYYYKATGDPPSQDSNRWVSKILAAQMHIFMRGYVYFASPSESQKGQGIQRKLIWVGDETTAAGSGGTWDAILDSWETNTGPPSTLSLSFVTQGSACHGDSPQDWMPGTPDLSWDTWYSLEIEVGLNTPVPDPGPFDGTLRVWLDGDLIWERTDIKINGNCTTPFTFFSIGRQMNRYVSATEVSEYRYWDDVVISSSYIGP